MNLRAFEKVNKKGHSTVAKNILFYFLVQSGRIFSLLLVLLFSHMNKNMNPEIKVRIMNEQKTVRTNQAKYILSCAPSHFKNMCTLVSDSDAV